LADVFCVGALAFGFETFEVGVRKDRGLKAAAVFVGCVFQRATEAGDEAVVNVEFRF